MKLMKLVKILVFIRFDIRFGVRFDIRFDIRFGIRFGIRFDIRFDSIRHSLRFHPGCLLFHPEISSIEPVTSGRSSWKNTHIIMGVMTFMPNEECTDVVRRKSLGLCFKGLSSCDNNLQTQNCLFNLISCGYSVEISPMEFPDLVGKTRAEAEQNLTDNYGNDGYNKDTGM